MRPRDTVELLLLAAIWGASFLFIRMAIGEFGAFALAGVRVAGAALLLLPLLALRGEGAALKAHAGPIVLVGVIGSAMPFVMFGVAAQVLSAGVMSILNATTPMWGALIVWAWFGDRLNAWRVFGLLLGFAGVTWLAWDSARLAPDANGMGAWTAIGASLVATICYGFVAAFTKHRLAGVPSMAVAAGSQAAAAVVLLLPAWWHLPAAMPSGLAWSSAAALALICTGVAYVLYFRLIANVGAARATTVTFLIPLFAVLWGAMLLNEPVSSAMVVACVLILLGTGLSTGILRPPAWMGR